MSEEKLSFQAEVAKLLDIVVNSLYSNKEIFLRELISNASDSCDRLRYMSITNKKIIKDSNNDFQIIISTNKEKKQLIISDNGLGMNRDDLVKNLGTIAKSGTNEFMNSLTGDNTKDVSLIGQFGVGFYSAFMVSKKVEVITKKAGEKNGWHWVSDGKGNYRIKENQTASRGAKLILHLRKESEEYLEPIRLKTVVKTYSDHISIPVVLEPDSENKSDKPEIINKASALWMRAKNEISEDEYIEFYRHSSGGYDEPWHTLHFRAEGSIEYTSLLYIPTNRPFDLFDPERKNKIKLYVNRVFIADDLDGLLPPYLRFVRGVIDSPDLPLNISREMLQDNPQLKKIQKGLVSKILKELLDKNKKDESFDKFWSTFGAVLKEGLYEDFERREKILEICKFNTSKNDKLRSLKQYVEDMKDEQSSIFYITGDDSEILRKAPQIEAYHDKEIEVLLLTDPVDEFWISSSGSFQDHPFKSAIDSADEIDKIKSKKNIKKKDSNVNEEKIDKLVLTLKKALKDNVKDVKTTDRLRESAVCLVSETGGISIHMERMMRQNGQSQNINSPRILEINPNHSLIEKLSSQTESTIEETAYLLLDQARIIEGDPIPDRTAFAQRLAENIEKSLI